MFVLRVNGETVATTDEQVIGIRVQTARGEVWSGGLAPNEGVADIILDCVAPGGPRRLDQIEGQAMQDIRDRAVEGQSIGNNPLNVVTPSMAQQGPNDSTLRQGGATPSGVNPISFANMSPSRDLATGLQASDSETLTRRITAFGEHGDANKAIEDNPAGGTTVTPSSNQPGMGTTPPPAPTDQPSLDQFGKPFVPPPQGPFDSGLDSRGALAPGETPWQETSETVQPNPMLSPGSPIEANRMDTPTEFTSEPVGTEGVVEASGIRIVKPKK